MLLIFALIGSGELSLPVIYLAEFILAVLFVFLSNAFSASYPNLVSRENLTKINAYTQGMDSMLSIFIPILGGVIYGIIDVKWFFVINGISFILSAFSEMFIDFHMFGDKVTTKMPFIQNLKEGFRYISGQKLFMTIAVYALFINFFMSAFSIVLPYNLITIHEITPETNEFIQSVFPVGAIIMSVYVGKKNLKFSHHLLRNTIVMFGLLMLMFALPTMGIFELGFTMPISYLLTGLLLNYIPSYSILLFSAFALAMIGISIHNNSSLKEVAVA